MPRRLDLGRAPSQQCSNGNGLPADDLQSLGDFLLCCCWYQSGIGVHNPTVSTSTGVLCSKHQRRGRSRGESAYIIMSIVLTTVWFPCSLLLISTSSLHPVGASAKPVVSFPTLQGRRRSLCSRRRTGYSPVRAEFEVGGKKKEQNTCKLLHFGRKGWAQGFV